MTLWQTRCRIRRVPGWERADVGVHHYAESGYPERFHAYAIVSRSFPSCFLPMVTVTMGSRSDALRGIVAAVERALA